jgi:putative beta-barrel porin BBP2
MWLEYLRGHMRNYKISRLSCTVLFLLLAILPTPHLSAVGEELATSGDGNQSGSDESGTTQSIGIGKFAALPFHVSVSVRGGFDDNVPTAASAGRQGSTFANVNLAATYDFGSPRMIINLQTNGGITYYSEQPDGITYDFNPNLNFSITYKANPRLTLSETTYAAYQNQPDFQYNAGTNRRSGSFFYSTNKFSAAYRWRPRFSTVTSYTFGLTRYDDAQTAVFENRFEHTFGNEFRFLVWPTTSVIAEYRLALLDYENPLRDSTSNFFLGGLDHNFSPRFNISARAGVEIRSYEAFGSRADPYFEGTLTYALGPHLSLSWNNRYSLEEPDVPGSQARTTFRTGLTGGYKLTPRITASLSAFYQHDENDPSMVFIFVQPGFAEDSLSLSLTLRYAVNHTWGGELGWDFTNVASDIALREYYRNRFYGGINFTF